MHRDGRGTGLVVAFALRILHAEDTVVYVELKSCTEFFEPIRIPCQATVHKSRWILYHLINVQSMANLSMQYKILIFLSETL